MHVVQSTCAASSLHGSDSWVLLTLVTTSDGSDEHVKPLYSDDIDSNMYQFDSVDYSNDQGPMDSVPTRPWDKCGDIRSSPEVEALACGFLTGKTACALSKQQQQQQRLQQRRMYTIPSVKLASDKMSPEMAALELTITVVKQEHHHRDNCYVHTHGYLICSFSAIKCFKQHNLHKLLSQRLVHP